MDVLQLFGCFRHRRRRTLPQPSVTDHGHHSGFSMSRDPPDLCTRILRTGEGARLRTDHLDAVSIPGAMFPRSCGGSIASRGRLPSLCRAPVSTATDRGKEGRPHLCPYDEQSRGAGIICLAVWGNRRLHRFPRTIRLAMKLNFCQSCRILSASWPSVWCRC